MATSTDDGAAPMMSAELLAELGGDGGALMMTSARKKSAAGGGGKKKPPPPEPEPPIASTYDPSFVDNQSAGYAFDPVTGMLRDPGAPSENAMTRTRVVESGGEGGLDGVLASRGDE